MPWELTIRSSDNTDLGDVATVRDQITAALPTIQFRVEPSGLEKLAMARAAGVEFPDVLRRNMEQCPASLEADFDGGKFLIQFYGFEHQPLQKIYVDVRGNGNPLPALAALCMPNGWLAIDNASSKPIELTGTMVAEWAAFRNYRDRAVNSILKSEDFT